jgi:ribose transport system ATP-binding protein
LAASVGALADTSARALALLQAIWAELSRSFRAATSRRCFRQGIWRGADIYIFDEPTVGVDMGTRRLYRLIKEIAEAGKAVVVISSTCRK